MAADALEGDRRPARVAVARAAAGLERDLAEHGRAVQRQLPADQPRQRLHRGRVERQVGERAQAGDAGRVAVVALRLGTDDRGLDAARAALEDHPVAVDEEVVADVVPAVGVAVVARDALDDPGRFLGRVVDGGDRVVHERHLHVAVAGTAARRDAVGAPAGARDDRGRARLAGAARARRAGAWGRARTKRAFRPRTPPRRRSWNSSALPVKTGSVRSRSPAWLCGSGVQRVQRPRSRRARTWACGVPPAHTRPSRSKRRGARSTVVVRQPRRRHARRSALAGRARTAPARSAAKAGEGRRSAPSAAAPAPRRTAWRRVRRGPSIRGFEHRMAAIGASRAAEWDLPPRKWE